MWQSAAYAEAEALRMNSIRASASAIMESSPLAARVCTRFFCAAVFRPTMFDSLGVDSACLRLACSACRISDKSDTQHRGLNERRCKYLQLGDPTFRPRRRVAGLRLFYTANQCTQIGQRDLRRRPELDRARSYAIDCIRPGRLGPSNACRASLPIPAQHRCDPDLVGLRDDCPNRPNRA